MDRITNEYHGQEFFKSVSEKYASQSGCEWKMPTRSMPCVRASRSAASRSSGLISYRAPCAPSYAFSIGTAKLTSFFSPSTRPSIAPQHSLGKVLWACSTIADHAVFSISIMPEGLAQIFVRAVRQDRDNHAALAGFGHTLADLAGCDHVCSR